MGWEVVKVPSEALAELWIDETSHGSDRHIAGQLPVKNWHTYIGDPAVADVALDRVVHNAHHLMLKGESMRKKRSTLTNATDSAT